MVGLPSDYRPDEWASLTETQKLHSLAGEIERLQAIREKLERDVMVWKVIALALAGSTIAFMLAPLYH